MKVLELFARDKGRGIKRFRRVEGGYRAVPSPTSNIGSIWTEGEAGPVATNMKTFPSHLGIYDSYDYDEWQDQT